MKNFNFRNSVQQFIDSFGFETYTKIQEETIPLALRHKNILGISDTGTGKTLAYLLVHREELKTYF